MTNKAILYFSTGQFEKIELEMSGTTDDIIHKWFEFKEKWNARYQEELKNIKKEDDKNW